MLLMQEPVVLADSFPPPPLPLPLPPLVSEESNQLVGRRRQLVQLGEDAVEVSDAAAAVVVVLLLEAGRPVSVDGLVAQRLDVDPVAGVVVVVVGRQLQRRRRSAMSIRRCGR